MCYPDLISSKEDEKPEEHIPKTCNMKVLRSRHLNTMSCSECQLN